MKWVKCTVLSKLEKRELLELWNTEYPEKLQFQTVLDFDSYLNNLTELSHFLLIDPNRRVKGWYFNFKRENEKWFAILLNTEIQGRGMGSQIINRAKEQEKQLNGWVIDHGSDKKRNGELYKSPIEFYMKNGFNKVPTERLELDKISAVKIQWTR